VWLKPTIALENRFNTAIFKQAEKTAFKEISLARSWGTQLVEEKPFFEIRLLRQHADDAFVLGVLEFPFDRRYVQSSRLDRYLWHDDPIVKSRARKLWKLKYHLSDQRYQEWIKELDKPHPKLSAEQSLVFDSIRKPQANTNHTPAFALPIP
jgi:hypothetical protein